MGKLHRSHFQTWRSESRRIYTLILCANGSFRGLWVAVSQVSHIFLVLQSSQEEQQLLRQVLSGFAGRSIGRIAANATWTSWKFPLGFLDGNHQGIWCLSWALEAAGQTLISKTDIIPAVLSPTRKAQDWHSSQEHEGELTLTFCMIFASRFELLVNDSGFELWLVRKSWVMLTKSQPTPNQKPTGPRPPRPTLHRSFQPSTVRAPWAAGAGGWGLGCDGGTQRIGWSFGTSGSSEAYESWRICCWN